MSAWPATVAPLHFWKANWSGWFTNAENTDEWGKWLFCTPTKAERGIVASDVIVTRVEVDTAMDDIRAAKRAKAYRDAVEFLVKDGTA